MEYDRMMRKLQGVVQRSYTGQKRIRVMDVEAVKEAIERLDGRVPDPNSKQIGFGL